MLNKLLSALLVVVLVVGVHVVLAQEDEEEVSHGLRLIMLDDDTPSFAMFEDGRLNATDIGAPIVIFYKYEPVRVLDADGNPKWDDGKPVWADQFAAIEVLSIEETGAATLALRATLDDIRAAVDAAGGVDCCIVENGPVSLHYSESGWFWVEGLYRDGKPYAFQWEGFGF